MWLIASTIDPGAATRRNVRHRGPLSFPKDITVNFTEVADKLRDIAARARRLSPPLAHDPERFHIERSDLAAHIDMIAHSISPRGDTVTSSRMREALRAQADEFFTVGKRRYAVQRTRRPYAIVVEK